MNTVKFKTQNEMLNEALDIYNYKKKKDEYTMMYSKSNCDVIGDYVFIRNESQLLAVYDAREIEFLDIDIKHLKGVIVDQIRDKAEWRAWKAEEYPDDKRNEESSITLYQLRNYVAKLHEGHDFFVLQYFPIERIWEEMDLDLSRYGFDFPDPDHKLMVRRVVEMMKKEIQRASESNEDKLRESLKQKQN